MLTISTAKPGDVVRKLRLSLNKGATFSVEMFWDSKHDLDAHALLCHNDGTGAKVSEMERVLSTYNSKKTNRDGVLVTNPNGSFATPCGTLTHSGDALSGDLADIDEIITVNGAKAPVGVNEIPIFVTIHKASATGATFGQVTKAGIRIKDDTGRVLGEYELSKEFAQFSAVQAGSFLCNEGGWEFAPVGVGFNADFNGILEKFS